MLSIVLVAMPYISFCVFVCVDLGHKGEQVTSTLSRLEKLEKKTAKNETSTHTHCILHAHAHCTH